jgi:tetratricopeptide (TPR) repeat protein
MSSAALPLFPLARYADGFAPAMRGQIDEAVARNTRGRATDPLIVDPASQTEGMRQAAGALRRGSLSAARAALEQIVKAFPRSSEAHRMLATVASIGGDTRSSVEHLEAALQIRPDDERSWIAMANTQIDAGALGEAARTLEKAIAAIPTQGGLRWKLAGLLVKAEQNGDALTQYLEGGATAAALGTAQVHQAVATLALVQLDAAGAAAAVDRRTRENLNDAAAHRDLARVFTKQGRQTRRSPNWPSPAWLDPDDPLTFVGLGRSLMANGRDEDAVPRSSVRLRLQPDLREARYALGQALTRASRPADAQRHLLEFERQRAAAVARERRSSISRRPRGEAAKKSAAGQHRLASRDLEKVIALEPDVAQNYLDLAERW